MSSSTSAINMNQPNPSIPSLPEINSMLKPELRQTLLNVLNMEPWLSAAADSCSLATSIASLASELRKNNEQNQELRSEIQSLRTQVTDLQTSAPPPIPLLSTNGATSTPSAPPPAFADVVRSTMMSTIREEKAQAQVVISNVKEEGNDLRFMSSLCEKINNKSMPKNVSRMGTKLADRVRPMVVTFDSNFDARTFMSRFGDSKSDEDVSTPPIKIRPYRSSEDQTMYKKKLEKARELNRTAKEKSPDTSFSLRNNGCIWKYIKDPACNKWRRDTEWSDSEDRDNTKPKESTSENGQ